MVEAFISFKRGDFLKKHCKKRGGIFIAFVMAFLLVSCSSTQDTESSNGEVAQSDQNVITITGLEGGDIEVSVDEIKQLERVEGDLKSISSSGETKKTNITGGRLEELLEKHNTSLKNMDGLRFIAKDEYAIDIPKEILENRDIILAYEIDGKPLHEKAQPIRTVVPEERSMYWVQGLSEIELVKAEESTAGEKSSSIGKLILLDSAITTLETVDYEYYEEVDEAIRTSDLLNSYAKEDKDQEVYLKASDNLEKSESNEIFKEAFIKTTGENAPMLGSPNMPKGMTVKNLLWFTIGDTKFLSMEKALEMPDLAAEQGVSLRLVLEDIGLKNGEAYVFTALDGSSIEISSEDAKEGILEKEEDGSVLLSFPNLHKKNSVKELLSIEVK